MSQINVTHVYDASGGNTATLHGVLDTPHAFRNKIRNPKMDIGQRGASFATPVSGAYTLDGWLRDTTGTQVVSHSQQADVMVGSDCQNSLRVTVTTANAALAASHYECVQQPIEGYLVRDMQGNPIALRFEVKSSKTGTHCVSLRNSGFDRSYVLTYNVASANTWQLVTLPLPVGLITAGTWNWGTGAGVRLAFVLACGSTYQTTAGAWQTGNYFATSAQVNCMDTVGNVFAITGVQLERGTTSSPLEHRDIGSELIFNQRYYEAVSWPSFYISGNTGNAIYVPVAYKVVKRVTPTVTFPSSTNSVWSTNGTLATATAWSVQSADNYGFAINAQLTGGIAGVPANTYTSSAEL